MNPFGWYPKRLAEANVQAEFYFWARTIGLKCLLEFFTPAGKHDIACFSSDGLRLVALVECKRPDGGYSPWQIGRYKAIGVPVYGLNDPMRAQRLAERIKERHDQLGQGKTFEQISECPWKRRSRKPQSPNVVAERYERFKRFSQ